MGLPLKVFSPHQGKKQSALILLTTSQSPYRLLNWFGDDPETLNKNMAMFGDTL
jgi:hypothetical protein